jgi:solute carrier family 26, other
MLNLNETEEHEDDLNNIISSFNNRPIYNETILKEKYSFDDDYKLDEDEIFENTKNYLKKHYKPTQTCMRNYFVGRFPILKWITKYDIKHDILKDLVAGLTVGIIQIAPTMANSMMANLPPINGLYVAFFAVMAYFFMGTCRHLSLGTHGVISLVSITFYFSIQF